MTDGLENPRRADMFLSLIGLTSCAGTAAYVIIQKLAPVYLLPLAVASAALVGWMRLRQLSRLAMDVERSSMRLFLLAATIFFALVSTSLLLFVTRDSPYERPTGFFVIVAIMAGLLGVEAISVPQDSRLFGLILAQTGLLGIELMWTQSLMFPEVLGVDSAWHQAFTELTLKAGRLPDGYSYSNLPLMHLQIGSFQLITGWSYKWSSLFAVGSTQVLLSLLFVFLIAKALFSFRVGLLSAVLLVVSGSFVQFSWWVTPFAFAVVYCLAALYLQIVMRRRNPIASLVLALFFMFCIILTHPITSTWMAVLLFVVWGYFALLRRTSRGSQKTTSSPVSLVIVLVFGASMLSWWTYVSGHIAQLADLLRWGLSIDQFTHEVRLTEYWTSRPLLEQVADSMGLVMLVGLSLLGTMYAISHRGTPAMGSYAFASLTTVGIAFLTLVGQKVLSERWIFLAEVLIGAPAAVAVVLVANVTRHTISKRCVVFVAIAALAFLTITSSTASIDTRALLPGSSVRYAFTGSEFSAARFLAAHANESIATDFNYGANPSSSIFLLYFGVDYGRLLSLDSSLYQGNFSSHKGEILVIRSEVAHHPFILAGGVFKLEYDVYNVLDNEGFSRIYDDGGVAGYS